MEFSKDDFTAEFSERALLDHMQDVRWVVLTVTPEGDTLVPHYVDVQWALRMFYAFQSVMPRQTDNDKLNMLGYLETQLVDRLVAKGKVPS